MEDRVTGRTTIGKNFHILFLDKYLERRILVKGIRYTNG